MKVFTSDSYLIPKKYGRILQWITENFCEVSNLQKEKFIINLFLAS